jgi:hypothetical protein
VSSGIGVPSKRGPIFAAGPHVAHKPLMPPRHARYRAIPTAKPMNTSAATSHSNATATTPINENRTETATIAVGPWVTGGGMKELSKRDWLFVALAAFVMSGTAFVILYWLYRIGWRLGGLTSAYDLAGSRDAVRSGCQV